MSRVRNKNTNIELKLRKKLWHLGYRYKTNYKVFGKPDIVFVKHKVAIFCDGDFWHGKNFSKEKGGYKKFWVNKINSNMERDKKVNKRLLGEGWIVMRFWKSEILRNTDACVKKITKIII